MLPSGEQIKQFLLGVVLPPVVGFVATYLTVHVPLLSTFFHVSAGQIGAELTTVVTFGVTTLIAWLTQHHVLSGHYTAAARAAQGAFLPLKEVEGKAETRSERKLP